jgi:ubiquinone/menaquinone biosynthesis C-methylase UbiE
VADASERLEWAVETLDPQPADRILEIGCGHGVAVHLICGRLETGEITAVDKSEKMIATARRKNADAIAAGRAKVGRGEFPDVDLGDARFDKVFGVHVAPLWKQAEVMLPVVRRLLRPTGHLYLFDHVPPQMADAAALRRKGETIAEALARQGFEAAQRVEETSSGTGLCVIGAPS